MKSKVNCKSKNPWECKIHPKDKYVHALAWAWNHSYHECSYYPLVVAIKKEKVKNKKWILLQEQMEKSSEPEKIWHEVYEAEWKSHQQKAWDVQNASQWNWWDKPKEEA